MPATRPAATPPTLEIRGLHHTYGSGAAAVPAIAEVSLVARAREVVSIVGPSGCGKTTLLRCVAGLLRATSGTVTLHGQASTGVPSELALVFQDYSRSLFPWMTVGRNVEFPLHGLGRQERKRRAHESLDAVGLDGVGDRYPWQLSGGMQQRVAIARALAYQPSVLLMDEPFASVDAQTRADLEDLLLRLRDMTGTTILFVTHDIDESIYVGDRVVVLTPTPATVALDLAVELPVPRDQIATKECESFVRLRAEVARLIRDLSKGARGGSDAGDEAVAS